MKYLIGLDIGTSAVKGVLLSDEGRVIDTVNGPFTYTEKGSARLLDPEEFISTCFGVIRDLAAAADGAVAAISACCASGNIILLDENMKPTTPIIGWQTTVPMADIEKLHTKEEIDGVYNIVGWPALDSFPFATLSSMRVNRPDLLDSAKMVTMSAEYLAYRLTGKWGISHSMGTPFYLMDQEKGVYNKALLEKLGICECKLPPIYDKGTVLGAFTAESAAELGVDTDTKYVLGSFDHPSGALGAGVLKEGEMLLSCGTSWVELFPVKSREFAISTGGLVDRYMLDGAPYCVMKSLTSVTEKINYLRNKFFGSVPHKEFDGYVGKGELGCGGLAFDFDDLDAVDPQGHTKPEIARAIIESAARMLGANLAELKKCGLECNKVVIIGGITNAKVCIDVIEEVLGIPLESVNGQSAGAVGSAMLAGIGTGIFAGETAAFDKMYAALKG